MSMLKYVKKCARNKELSGVYFFFSNELITAIKLEAFIIRLVIRKVDFSSFAWATHLRDEGGCYSLYLEMT